VIALAIRRPADIVEALGLKESDEVELRIAGLRTVEIARAIAAERREAALARIKESRWKFSPDWQFDRDDGNSR
jgi:antitoxin MazE